MTEIVTGDIFRTDMIPDVYKEFGTLWSAYVTVYTAGINDFVEWDLDYYTYWRTDYRNIVMMLP